MGVSQPDRPATGIVEEPDAVTEQDGCDVQVDFIDQTEQLRQNLGAVGWTLTPDQLTRLNEESTRTAAYPYFPYQRQEGFARLNPPVGDVARLPAA